MNQTVNPAVGWGTDGGGAAWAPPKAHLDQPLLVEQSSPCKVKGEMEGRFEMLQKHCVIVVTAGIGGYREARAMGLDLAEFPVDPDQ